MNHQRLLDKLWNFGIRGALFKWLQSYFVGRNYAVRIGGGCSEFFVAPSGILQDSGLGPILFSRFTNNLNLLPRFVKSLLYANDTKFFICFNSPLDCSKLQRDISAFAGWATDNGLPFNAAKCAVNLFPLSIDYRLCIQN